MTVEPNTASLVRAEDGSVIRQIQTESIHGSGIAVYNGALWIANGKYWMAVPASGSCF